MQTGGKGFRGIAGIFFGLFWLRVIKNLRRNGKARLSSLARKLNNRRCFDTYDGFNAICRKEVGEKFDRKERDLCGMNKKHNMKLIDSFDGQGSYWEKKHCKDLLTRFSTNLIRNVFLCCDMR